jgi:DNA polymerase-3 subunit gamma/tau
MSESQVIARKFRPRVFSEVVGQDAITRTLANALATGRLHHAYLFTGARGVGKTTTARILAKCLNCSNSSDATTDPCGDCPSCIEIAGSRSIDVQEIDAATYTKVEDTREVIINTIRIAPARDRYKIFIIDEVHMLSTSSFNALLKTLEEPPPNVVFIMATTDVHKVPETILSRCQVFEFRTISLGKILDQLRHIVDHEKVEISDRALLSIARAGEGSMRDAESALDQVISFAGSTIADEDVSTALGLVGVETLNQTVEAIAAEDSQRIVKIVDDVVSRGYDVRNFCREMMTHLRGLLMIKIAGFDPELTQMSEGDGETLARLAEAFSEQDLLRFFSILTKTEQDIRVSSQPRFQLEMGLLKLAHASKLVLLEDAIHRLNDLQARLGGAISSGPGAGLRDAAGKQDANRDRGTPSGTRPVQKVWGQSASSAHRTVAPRRQTALREQPTDIDDTHESDRPEPSTQNKPSGTHAAKQSRANLEAGDNAIRAIKEELEANGKMYIVTALDQGEMTIDGDYLKIAYGSSGAVFKTQLEAREKRLAIEEACQKVLGKRLSLVVLSGSAQPTDGVTRKSAAAAKQKQDDHDPKLKAFIERFHGEVIEVIKPEGQD